MGGGTPPAPPSPQEEANASLTLLREEERMRRQRELEDRMREKKEERQQANRYRNLASKQYNQALGSIDDEFSARGLNDTYGIEDYYRQQLTNRYKQYDPRSGADPGSLFADVSLDDVVNMFQDRERGKYRTQAESTFGMDYGADAIGYDTDDSILDEILGQQRTDTLEGLNRARDRGQLNDNAYSRALQELDRYGEIGRAKFETMGRGVLDRYRTGVNTAVDNVYNSIGNWKLGSGFNPLSEFDRVNRTKDDYLSNLRGDVLGAVGDTEVFDLNKLVGKARNVTGYSGGSTTNSGGLTNQISTQLRQNNPQGVF